MHTIIFILYMQSTNLVFNMIKPANVLQQSILTLKLPLKYFHDREPESWCLLYLWLMVLMNLLVFEWCVKAANRNLKTVKWYMVHKWNWSATEVRDATGTRFGKKGVMVVQWLAPLPHVNKVTSLNCGKALAVKSSRSINIKELHEGIGKSALSGQ